MLQRRTHDTMIRASSLALLAALAAAAFGRGAFSGRVQWSVFALVVVAFALALGARAVPVADLTSVFFLTGLVLALWALLRAAAAGTPASGVSWALFGAGTAAVVCICRRLDATSREMLLRGLLAVGAAVAITGWLGVALHQRPWGLPSQGLWRAASTLTYANATAAFLVPLALVALACLTATPRSAFFSLTATCLLAGAGAALSRAGVAALAAGLLVMCLALGTRATARAAAGPVVGAGVVLLGLLPSVHAASPGRPLVACTAAAAGLVITVLAPRVPLPALLLPVAGAALVAALIMVYRAPAAHSAIHTITRVRFSLSSPARAGEAAAALHIFERHPLTGVGPGHATLRWTGPGGGLRVDRFAHDEYLQVLADLGLAGAALLATFIVSGGRLLWRARPARSDWPQRAAWAGAVAGVTAFVLHSGFDFIWQVPAIPLAIGAIVGLTVAAPAASAH